MSLTAHLPTTTLEASATTNTQTRSRVSPAVVAKQVQQPALTHTAPSQHLFFTPIKLADQQPLAVGGERLIYQHPHDPHLLIKVMDARERARRRAEHPIKHWHKRFRRSPYKPYLTELSEYVASQAPTDTPRTVPLARTLGLVQTDIGLGLLSEKITDQDGNLAPTVRELVSRDGLTPALREQLDALFAGLTEAHVLFNDVGASNIVSGSNANGQQGLWVIDGFGNKQAIPLFALNKTWNRRRMMRKYGEMLAKLERLDQERQQ